MGPWQRRQRGSLARAGFSDPLGLSRAGLPLKAKNSRSTMRKVVLLGLRLGPRSGFPERRAANCRARGMAAVASDVMTVTRLLQV
jgi:hypothetical protein